MKLLPLGLHVLIVLVMPIVMIGIVNRTKSMWAGRRGPPMLQSGWDLLRLLRKRALYSANSTALFRAGAWVVLASSLLASLVAPMLGAQAPLQFSNDFILFACTLGLARIFLMLSAMDVGSSFEGMGAAREASFTAVAEPALFLLIGSAGVATGQASFAGLISQWQQSAGFAWLALSVVAVLFVLLQVEASRVPVDDPMTHLELTMVHEVMILDHSGPELAAMQYASALKLNLYAGLIATLLNPFDPQTRLSACAVFSLLTMALVAIAVGCVESLMARLRLQLVPLYLLAASLAAALCLGLAGWLAGGT